MRTTLILNDTLLERAKKVAAERRQSLSALVNDALRTALEAEAQPHAAPKFTMPVFRPPGSVGVDTTPDQLDELIAAEDRAPYRHDSV